jgi:DNA-binding MarR family transcriptional regulator
VAWLDMEERAAWQGLMQMELQLSGVLGRQLYQDSRLSLQDYGVLVCLTEQPEGRMRAFELGRQLGWEKSRLSHHISRMAGRGLVARQQCPSDQRGSLIVVTDHGREVIEAAAPGHVAAVRRHFVDLLSRGQLDQLTAITSAVLSALQAECQGVEGEEADGVDGCR